VSDEPRSDIRFPLSQPVLAGRECEYALGAIRSGWISSVGEYVERFEKAVGDFLGREPGVAVTSGTTALHLACRAMNVGPGQDVIVPSLTFVATANAVSYCGGRPVFADSDAGTWNVSVRTIEQAWTPDTVGVLLVHLYGLPAPAVEIAQLCRERGAWLIEDCAQALGARIGDRFVGSFGDAATFSFFGNKIISTGEGGMVFLSDPENAAHVRLLRGQGMDLTADRRYLHVELGYNYRMTNVAAAIGLGQVEMIDLHLTARQEIATAYYRELARLQERGMVKLPATLAGYHNVFWLFSVVLSSGGPRLRDRTQRALSARGIDTRPFFVPMHELPIYADGVTCLPVSKTLADHGLSLPTYTGLSPKDVRLIASALEEVLTEVE
jgi:perosamine synthetase